MRRYADSSEPVAGGRRSDRGTRTGQQAFGCGPRPAALRPERLSIQAIVGLQRSAGNSAVARLLAAGSGERRLPSTPVQRCRGGCAPGACRSHEQLESSLGHDDRAKVQIQPYGSQVGRDAQWSVAERKLIQSDVRSVTAKSVADSRVNQPLFRDGYHNSLTQLSLQRAVGDNHDLTSPRFAGEPVLEACYDDEARLTKGATGPAVVKIQQALVDLGYNLGPRGTDGIYGTYTWNAVKQFKKNESLGWEHMGDVGPGTMRRLNELFPAGPLPPCPTDDDHGVATAFADPSGPKLEPPKPGENCTPKPPPKPQPKPATGSFAEAETVDNCLQAAAALPEGFSRIIAVQLCIVRLDALAMKQVIQAMQALRTNFRGSYAILVSHLDVTFAPRVEVAHQAITDPEGLKTKNAAEMTKTAFISQQDADEALFFARLVAGGRVAGLPTWSDPATGLPRARPGKAPALTTDQQRMLDYIRENRASIRQNPELRGVGVGLQYLGHSSRDPDPTAVSATAAGSLEHDLWDELKGEGGSSAINTFDTAKLTWGRGFAATGTLNLLFDKLYTKAPGLIDELYQAGFALPRGGSNNDYLAVDLLTGLVVKGNAALDLIRKDKQLHSLLIGLAEADEYKQQMADAQFELLRQGETFRPLADSSLRAAIAAWPRTSVRFVAHSIHLAGVFNWHRFLPTGGDLGQIASIVFRGLGGNWVLQSNGARLSRGLASHAPMAWAGGVLNPLLSAPLPLPADCQTNPAFSNQVFLPNEPSREPIDDKGVINVGMSVRVFNLR